VWTKQSIVETQLQWEKNIKMGWMTECNQYTDHV